MTDKNSKPPEHVTSYLISIKGGNKDRTIRLSSGTFRFAVASVILGGLLLVGTAAYSFYSTMRMQRDAATIYEIEQAAELRQEQLLTLSKKAATLSETIQNLAQQEQELRIQAGLNPPKDDAPIDALLESIQADADANPTAEETSADDTAVDDAPAQVDSDDVHDGQGGPVEELDIADVSEALDMLEVKVSSRKESLDDFQNSLKQQREQMARGAAVASGYSPNFESYSAAAIPSRKRLADYSCGGLDSCAGLLPVRSESCRRQRRG